MPTLSCPVAGHHWKELGSIFTLSLQVFVHIDENPSPSEPSPGWTDSGLSAFFQRRLTSVPSISLWLFVGLFPIHPHLSLLGRQEWDPILQVWPNSPQHILVHTRLPPPCTELCTSCWTSRGFCQPISLSCQGPSRWHHNPLLYQPLLATGCCQQTVCPCSTDHPPPGPTVQPACSSTYSSSASLWGSYARRYW